MEALHAQAKATPPAEQIEDDILQLQPKTETQRWLKAEALKLTEEVLRTRWRLLSNASLSVPRTFLVAAIFWLSMTFGSFGLSAPRNATVVTVFVISTLSVAAAVFLILELDGAFEGIIRISSEPFRYTLSNLGKIGRTPSLNGTAPRARAIIRFSGASAVLRMAPFSPIPPRHPIRVVLSSTALLPFMSVRKAAALAIAQLGVAAFFVAGVTRSALGESAVWFVLAATVLAAFVRAIDIESWALLIPGGFVSRVTSAFGPRAAGLAKAAALVERLLLGALACVVVGHYVAGVSATAIAGWRFTGYVRPEDLATLLAVGAIGLLWLRTRIGRDIGRDTMARGVWIGVGILAAHHGVGRRHARRGGGIAVAALAVAPSTGGDHGLAAHRCCAGLPARIRADADRSLAAVRRWRARPMSSRRPACRR